MGLSMRRIGQAALILAITSGGCALPSTRESPVIARANSYDTGNEMLLRTDNPGPEAYSRLFESVLDVIDNDFEVTIASRYDGRIEAAPRIAPGYEQIFKPGSPSLYERLLATCQTIRHRCIVTIQPAEGGYVVNVTVLKELEDLPNPTREQSGSAVFRTDANIDREREVIDPLVISTSWIPKGRDCDYEQKILREIRRKIRD
jgi:hypothetical protein